MQIVIAPEQAGIPYHAYSASGELTASVVAAGAGEPADYATLARRGITVRGKIVIAGSAGPYSYRGFKVFTAERQGAAGILITGSGGGTPWVAGVALHPDGPWGPRNRIQRGGVAYDFIVPGDPLTPGWASVPGAPRLRRPRLLRCRES